MTPNAINDVKNTTNKTVFIYTTAGDADSWRRRLLARWHTGHAKPAKGLPSDDARS
jgi:hypothetical protein